jgi:polar amino acid transport system substrate-binding protein
MLGEHRLDRRDFNRRDFIGGAAKLGVGMVVSAGLVGAVLEACGGSSSSPGSSNDLLAEGRKQGFLRVAYINKKPGSYIDPQTNKLVGSGPEIIEPLLNRIGIPNVQPTVCEFSAIIPGLLAKHWDLSAIPFFITPERCAQVAFTDPEGQFTEGALVRSGNPLNIHSYKDMAANPKIRVSVQQGDAEATWAKQIGIADHQMTTFPQEALAVQALKEGRVDAYLNSTYALRQDIINYTGKGIEVATPFTGPVINGVETIAYDGWATRVEDSSLRLALNDELHKMTTSGEWLSIMTPYGYDKTMLPGVVTAVSLCPANTWAK